MLRACRLAVSVLALLTALVWCRPVSATIVVPMPDEDLAAQADAVVIGDVAKITSHWDDTQGRIFTTITIAVHEVLKGDVTESQLTLTQMGGTIADVHAWVHGNPEFRRGEKVLVFVTQAQDGTLRVTQLYQGKFSITTDPYVFDELAQRDPNPGGVHTLPVPGGPQPVDSWKLRDLKDQIRGWTARHPRHRKLLPVPTIGADVLGVAGDTFTFLGTPSRWFEPDAGNPVTVMTNRSGEPLTPGGGFTEVRAALNAWTSAAGSSLDFRDGGLTDAQGLTLDGINAVSFRDPLQQIDQPVGCRGTLAIGGYYTNGETRVVNGKTFYRIIEGDVTTADGWQGCGFYENRSNFAEVLTHELGHMLGFGHNTDYDATMAPVAHFDGRGASLRAADIAGLVFMYPGSGGTTGGTPTSFTLSVSRAGGAGGMVTSSPAGINCGTDCSQPYTSGTPVTLTASAPAGMAFTGWSGACTGTGSCAVTINANTSVTASFTTAQPDLRVSTVSEPPVSAVRGGGFAVTESVTNGGASSSASSRTRYYLSTTGTHGAGDVLLAGSRLVSTLAAGAESTGTVTATIPTTAPFGTYRLIACADDTAVVGESNETNNCRASAGTIVIGTADLVVTTISNPPASAKRGTAFAVTDTVKNQGDAAAGASTTRYYLSLDGLRDTADRLMTGTRSVGTLAPASTSSGSVNVIVPSTLTPGSYFVIACADGVSRVTESTETNNCRTSATAVGVTP